MSKIERLLDETSRSLTQKNKSQAQSQLVELKKLIDESEAVLLSQDPNINTSNHALFQSQSRKYTLLCTLASSLKEPLHETRIVVDERVDQESLIQLHDQIISHQDSQLDSLSQILARQREIGQAINDELDEQVEIMEDTDRLIDSLDSNISRNLRRMGALGRETKVFGIMVTLIIVFIIVFALSRLL